MTRFSIIQWASLLLRPVQRRNWFRFKLEVGTDLHFVKWMGMLLIDWMIFFDNLHMSSVTIVVVDVVVVLFLIAVVILIMTKHWFIFDWTTIVAIRVCLAGRTMVMSVDSYTINVIFTNLAWF